MTMVLCSENKSGCTYLGKGTYIVNEYYMGEMFVLGKNAI